MVTLTLTSARANLGKLCDRAKRGEQIGIISGDQVFQLKPVEVIPWDETYLASEYGVSPDQAQRFVEQTDREIFMKERKGGYVVTKGPFDPRSLD